MLLKPKSLAPLAMIVGILFFMSAKRDRQKNIGIILLGFGVLFADAERLMEPEEGPRASLLRLIRREAVLYGDALCFHGLVSADDERAPRRFLQCCLEPLGDLEAPVFLCTDPGFALLPYTDRHTVRFDLPPCTRADRIALWQGFWKYYGLKAEGDFARYAATYKTSPRDIGKPFQRRLPCIS